LPGRLGLAPKWRTGYCGKDCMEKVSACVLSIANDTGELLSFEASSTAANADESVCPNTEVTCNAERTTADDYTQTIGVHVDDRYPVQEAVFFGNIFVSPPQLYWASSSEKTWLIQSRTCGGWGERCPFIRVGTIDTACPRSIGGTAQICYAGGATWTNVVTTYAAH
jgi:hypothetical protein